MDLVRGAQRIAVLKANALGDFIMTLPAVDALRAAYPAARITLLGRSWHEDFLRGRPSPIDDVYAIPHGALGDEADGLVADLHARVVRDLRARAFDVAVQLHGGGRNSNRLLAQIGARVTAGARTADAPMLDRNIHYETLQSDLVRCLEVVALVGASAVTLDPALAVTDDDLAESVDVVSADERPIVVVHPGASDTRRRWPPERFAAVADELVAAGARVVLTGNAAEREIVASVARQMRCAAEDVAGRLSLSALTGLLARADLLVGNDTGPRHLAAAVGTPTVAIYWVGNVITAAPLFRDRHRVLASWNLQCPLCGRNCITDDCGHRPSFVSDVATGAVLEHALDLFSGARNVRPAPAQKRSGVVERMQNVGDEVVGVLDADAEANERL
jgi:ADP-heptose:LPS heptosyltransferase